MRLHLGSATLLALLAFSLLAYIVIAVVSVIAV
jgi:hypothetical protein